MSPFFQWARLYRKKSMSLFWIIIILIKCIAPVFTVAAQRGKKSMKHKAVSCGDCSLGQRRTNRMMTNAIRWFIRLFSLFDDFHYKEAGSEASICLWSRSPPTEVFPDPVTSWGWVISLSLSLPLPQQHQPVQLVRASAPTDTVQAFLDAEKTCRIPITQEGGNPQHWAELYAQ